MALLAQRAGGFGALGELDTEPLPREPLAVDEVPEQARDRAVEIDDLVTGALTTLAASLPDGELDELLTACRRLLVQVAVGGPTVLLGRSTIKTLAAALAYVVGLGNGVVGPTGSVTVKELNQAFGVARTSTDLVRRFEDAAGLPGARRTDLPVLGSLDLLVSSARRTMLEQAAIARESFDPDA